MRKSFKSDRIWTNPLPRGAVRPPKSNRPLQQPSQSILPTERDPKFRQLTRKTEMRSNSKPSQRKQNLAVISLRRKGEFRSQQVNHGVNLIMIAVGGELLDDSFHLQPTPQNSHYKIINQDHPQKPSGAK